MQGHNGAVRVRKMCRKDLEAVVLIEEATFSEPWTKKGFLDSLEAENTVYLTAQYNGRTAGYCGFLQVLDEADITNVAVAEELRKKGIARAMLKELLLEGEKRGIKSFFLEVRAGNSAAISLYKSLGFSQYGIRKRFYEAPTEDALLMRKD